MISLFKRLATSNQDPLTMALQRMHGNRYVQRVVAGIQAKLVVGQPWDIYEAEAGRVAEPGVADGRAGGAEAG